MLNFKEWLESEGIDSDEFWEQCKNQKWYDNEHEPLREELKEEGAHFWINKAFNWQEYTDIDWSAICLKWQRELSKKGIIDVVFGFKNA